MSLSRILGWLIPCICMAAAIFVTYRQINTLKEAQVQHEAALGELQAANNLRDVMTNRVDDGRYAAVDDTDLEQTQFLEDLKSRAAVHNVVITNWSTKISALGAGAIGSSDSSVSEADRSELLTGLTRIQSNMTITGGFLDIQEFLKGIIASDRLMTLSNVTWSLLEDETSLAVTISRYVTNSQGGEGGSLVVQPATTTGVQP